MRHFVTQRPGATHFSLSAVMPVGHSSLFIAPASQRKNIRVKGGKRSQPAGNSVLTWSRPDDEESSRPRAHGCHGLSPKARYRCFQKYHGALYRKAP
jgi:hypothetical protein